MKYIVINNRDLEIPIIFSDLLPHRDVAGDKEVVSAGECSFYVSSGAGKDVDKVKVSVWGKSVGLNVLSRKEDSLLIEKCFGY